MGYRVSGGTCRGGEWVAMGMAGGRSSGSCAFSSTGGCCVLCASLRRSLARAGEGDGAGDSRRREGTGLWVMRGREGEEWREGGRGSVEAMQMLSWSWLRVMCTSAWVWESGGEGEKWRGEGGREGGRGGRTYHVGGGRWGETRGAARGGGGRGGGGPLPFWRSAFAAARFLQQGGKEGKGRLDVVAQRRLEEVGGKLGGVRGRTR